MTRTSAPGRILYLTTSGQVGGAERCLLSLIAGLDPARFRPEVVVGSPGPLPGLLDAAHIPSLLLPLPPALRQLSRYHRNPGAAPLRAAAEAGQYLQALRRQVAACEPDLIHSNGMKMHFFSAALPRAPRRPLVWHLHDFPARGAVTHRLMALCGRRADALVANSHAVAQAYAARFPHFAPKLRVIPNSVPLAALQSSGRAAQRRAWGLGPDDCVIGMIAIFAPWKGQAVFLEAARRVLAEIPRARFVLAGDDIYDTQGHGGGRRQLEALAQRLGIAAAVRFPGFVTDIAPAFAALDLAVHASTEPEPFGRTLIEAMAAGVPVIAARGGGVAEVVEDGVSGCLTPPANPEALAAAILALVRDPARRQSLAAAGRRRVEQLFSEAVVGRQFSALYDELLLRPSPVRATSA